MQASRGGESPWRRKGKIRTGRRRGTESVKPRGCTWHSRKRLLMEARRALALQEQLGSSEPRGRVGREEGVGNTRVRLGQIREAIGPSHYLL